jgi:3-oxoacyl-(acyl-carrier-protein) synthase
VPVVAWAGAFGHLGTCADLVHAALAARALAEGILPGTVGFERAEPGFEGLRVSATPTREPGAAILLVSGGPEGSASAAVLARP